MRFLRYIMVVLAAIAITSCKQDAYFKFNESARIQFGPTPYRLYAKGYEMADTVKPYTFYYEEPSVQEDTVFFDIYTVGELAKVDRTFTLQQENVTEGENAVAGKHYVAFTDSKASKHYVIKADSMHARVPVILLRDPSLKSSTVLLKFKVVENEQFKTGEASKLWRKIEFTDQLSRPLAWSASASSYYYGEYSLVKHQFMVESTGQRWDQDFMVGLPAEYGLLQFWLGKLKTNLVNYNNAHPGNPLVDENGNLVVFP